MTRQPGMQVKLPLNYSKPVCKTADRMDESFEIPVFYKNQELLFTARLIIMGFVHKFQVNVYGLDLFFEQDDCGDYRALVDLSKNEEGKKIDTALLKAIAASIESILK